MWCGHRCCCFSTCSCFCYFLVALVILVVLDVLICSCKQRLRSVFSVLLLANGNKTLYITAKQKKEKSDREED